MTKCDLAIKSLTTVLDGRDGDLPNEHCPLCCGSATAMSYDGDLVICLDGTAEVVCQECASEQDPDLASCLFHLQPRS